MSMSKRNVKEPLTVDQPSSISLDDCFDDDDSLEMTHAFCDTMNCSMNGSMNDSMPSRPMRRASSNRTIDAQPKAPSRGKSVYCRCQTR